MDARLLRRMTFGNRVITGGSHAPTESYARPSAGPSGRRRAPASPPQVQGLQTEDLSPRPLVAPLGRRRPDHLAVRRLPTPPRRPVRRDGPQGTPGHPARLRRPATAAQCRAGRPSAQGPPQAAPAVGHRPDLDPLPRPALPRPRRDLPRPGQGRHQPLPRLRHRLCRPTRAALHRGADRREEGRAAQGRHPTPAAAGRQRRYPAEFAAARPRLLQRGGGPLPPTGALPIPDAGGLPRPLSQAAGGPSGSYVFRTWKESGWSHYTLTDAQKRPAM